MPLSFDQFQQLRSKGLTPQQIAGFEAGNVPPPPEVQAPPGLEGVGFKVGKAVVGVGKFLTRNEQAFGNTLGQAAAAPMVANQIEQSTNTRLGLENQLSQRLATATPGTDRYNRLKAAIQQSQGGLTPTQQLSRILPATQLSTGQVLGQGLGVATDLLAGMGPGTQAAGFWGKVGSSALTGAEVGTGYGLSGGLQGGKTGKALIAPTLIGAGTGALTAAAVSAATQGIQAGVEKWRARGSEEAVNQSITDKYTKAIKPSVRSTADPSYDEKAVEGIKTIVRNKDQLVLDPANPGSLPTSVKEFQDAIPQIKKVIFAKYNAAAQQAGEAGVTVDLSGISDELQKVIDSPSLAISNPRAVSYAQSIKDIIDAHPNLSAPDAQDLVQQYNQQVQDFWTHRTGGTSAKAGIDAMVTNKSRDVLNTAVESVSGPQYSELKAQYGALKAIEADVNNRATVLARQTTPNIVGQFTNISSAGDLMQAITNPQQALVAIGKKAMEQTIKRMNDPNRAISAMFNSADELLSSQAPAVAVAPTTGFFNQPPSPTPNAGDFTPASSKMFGEPGNVMNLQPTIPAEGVVTGSNVSNYQPSSPLEAPTAQAGSLNRAEPTTGFFTSGNKVTIPLPDGSDMTVSKKAADFIQSYEKHIASFGTAPSETGSMAGLPKINWTTAAGKEVRKYLDAKFSLINKQVPFITRSMMKE